MARRVAEKAKPKSSRTSTRKSSTKPKSKAKAAKAKAKPYRPSDDEEFMNSRQKAYFREKLIRWRDEILQESNVTLVHLQEQTLQEPDIADRATIETERLVELRTRDRERKLLNKIEEALRRIDDGSYGYCEDTGDPISLRRLEARPIATLSIDAQERHEREERSHRDD